MGGPPIRACCRSGPAKRSSNHQFPNSPANSCKGARGKEEEEEDDEKEEEEEEEEEQQQRDGEDEKKVEDDDGDDNSWNAAEQSLKSPESLDSLKEGTNYKDQDSHLLHSLESLSCLLHRCSKERNCTHGLQLHVHMCHQGLESHPVFGNSLLVMFAKVGKIHYSQQVFNKLAYQDDFSWNTLINAFIEHGDLRHALSLYQATKHGDSIRLRGYTYMLLLKACAQLKNLEVALDLHADIVAREDLKRDSFVGSSLVHMYVKLGSMNKAQDSFDELLVRDAITWNTLIAGYAELRQGAEALNCYMKMQADGLSPNSSSFVSSLKACSSIGDMEKGKELHTDIVMAGLEEDGFVGNTLVDMYAKCGLLVEACTVFDKLHARTTVSWNVLISGYVECQNGEEALVCFDKMLQERVVPNATTFVYSLKACGSTGAIEKGQEIHEMASRRGLAGDLYVGNTLINMYMKFGMLVEAKNVFDIITAPDTVSWNALLSGYMDHGCGEEALKCFEQMQQGDVEPNVVTFVVSLNACGSTGAMEKGLEIHAEISRKALDGDLLIGNALVDMYAKLGLLQKTQEVFEKLPLRDNVSWSALITGYVEHGHGKQAIQCFEQEQLEGICPDAVTFACILKACSSVDAQDKGQEIHAMIVKQGVEGDLFVANTLIDMYANFGMLTHAQKVFDMLLIRDGVTWNSLLAGYADHGHGEEALNCFEQMQLDSIPLDCISFVCALKACGSLGAFGKCRELHDMIKRKGLETDLVIGSTLVDVYGKSGLLVKAQEVFDKLLLRDKVPWNSLIAGYVEAGDGERALLQFERMLHEGIAPDVATLACITKACGAIGAFERSRKALCMISGEELEGNPMVGASLIDMYVQCGMVAHASEVFEKLRVRDTVSWNALMAGYAQQGESEAVFLIFDRMNESRSPDLVTFLNILNVCSHAGLVHKGQIYFEVMCRGYGILPILEHHNCMVDLFGRAGQLGELEAMLKIMPCHPDLAMWNCMFNACRIWGNTELGREAFDQAVKSGEIDAANYISLQNMY